jgi:capsule biosynthesis phosphatase
MARICIDLDGVVAELKQPGQGYADVAPVPGARDKLRTLRAAGHYIILFTARHMKPAPGTPPALARVGQVTLQWLERHDIPYDEIHFGKPWADVYIDDNALRFATWDAIAGDGSNLPVSHEKELKRTLEAVL